MSGQTPCERFFDLGQLPVLGILLLALWILILLRLWGIKRSNTNLPSPWRTASGVSIVTTGVLCTVYFGLWVRLFVINRRVLAIDAKYDETPPPGPNSDMASIARNEVEGAYLLFSGRVVLTAALWLTKLAFVEAFLAVAYCLGTRLRWALYAVSTIILLNSVGCFILTLCDLKMEPAMSLTAEDVLNSKLYTQGGIVLYIFLNPVEYALTSLNMVTDIMLTILACFIVRVVPTSFGATTLLLFMLSITLATASTRLGLIVYYFKLSTRALQESDDNQAIISQTNLTVPVTVLSELEIILSAIVSCFPGMRAWARAHHTSPMPQKNIRYSDTGQSISEGKSLELDTQNHHDELVHEPAQSSAALV